MVRLDHQLLFVARSFINGANVHRLKELIFAYEQAVDLDNRQAPKARVYRIQIELELRTYVHLRREAKLDFFTKKKA